MDMRVFSFFAGALGGTARALLGFYKAYKRGDKFCWKPFAVTVVEAFVAGALFGAAQVHPVLAFVGAAGLTSFADKLGLQFGK